MAHDFLCPLDLADGFFIRIEWAPDVVILAMRSRMQLKYFLVAENCLLFKVDFFGKNPAAKFVARLGDFTMTEKNR